MIDDSSKCARQAARKRIIMVAGVQRSGTTALFDALATAPGVTPRNESINDEIYEDYFLRPEPEIRGVLARLPGTVLLKPVRESERRSPREISQEYADYDLTIVWLYRDPVNVFDSYVRRGWRQQEWSEAWRFAHEWQTRNASALANAGSLHERLVIVRYEDLAESALLAELGRMLGLGVTARFGADTALGRSRQPEDIRRLIDGETVWISEQLKTLRSLRPAKDHETSSYAASQMPKLSKECYETLDLADSGARSGLYAKWLAAGPIWRETRSGRFVAVGYETCRIVLSSSRPASPVPAPDPASGNPNRSAALGEFFAARRDSILHRQRSLLNQWAEQLPISKPFDLLARLGILTIDCTASWLGVPATIACALQREVQALSWSSREPAVSPAWDEVRDFLSTRGLVADLIAAGLLTTEEILGFLWHTGLRLLALPTVVSNSLCNITVRPAAFTLAKTDPAKIPGLFTEAMRLMPMWFSLRRTALETIRIDGIEIPAGATIDVIAAAANRDPAAFDSPDNLQPDRLGPPPLLIESSPATFCCMQDDAPWGCQELVFDLGLLVFEKLLLERFMRPPAGKGVTLLPMPSGNVLNMPLNCITTREQSAGSAR